MDNQKTRLEEVVQVFQRDRAAFMPFFTLGYPNIETSIAVVEACAGAGADLMELGIPFSDPLADGPTIQHSAQVALENGASVSTCLEAVEKIRKKGVTIPLILMGYINPILAYGVEKFVEDAWSAGAHGFIIPDLPPDEVQAKEIRDLCGKKGMSISYLASPNSPDDRIALITSQSAGFVYLVSVLGITGARQELPDHLEKFVGKVRRQTDKPLAVGFGISTPDQAAAVGEIADGVIVGSALVKAVGRADNKPAAAEKFVREIIEKMELHAKENII